ncbi:IBR domain, a half RING-finger domain-containing protein [Hirsutella rhossiliensis]|uniref:RBR-type E3 ubiquitin transferase n=1 Tax=Hirsutella rhossiliensis TaxID=111463 RepID=A0A9P8MNF7_9HYPO|nr:IBR domain, a half RING-finger domain-containing protein [Hirsutella rhossiliensis]KAH0958290.1 IBR domain, a half RING-finger domain-containing protein [Hirsutella rhossiliensis]
MAERDFDMESRQLALQLHMEEMESLSRLQKGKQREGDVADIDVAMGIYMRDLQDFVGLDSDQPMYRTRAHAVNREADLVKSIMAEEQQAKRDRDLAQALSGDHPYWSGANAGPSFDEDEPLDAGFYRRLEALRLAPDHSRGESSAQGAARGLASGGGGTRTGTGQCTACAEDHAASDLARCPCSHEYCHDCLTTLFEHATVNESLFPPRCCQQPIPVGDHLDILGSALVNKFRAKEAELSTPNRTYCHFPDCSAFVPPQSIKNGVAYCVRCHGQTCVTCKGQRHATDTECPQDEATKDVLRLGQENGWKRCYNCHRMVELDFGCNHMRCICQAEFCDACGQRWRTCSCPMWQENNLAARAEQVADRDANNRQLQGDRRVEVVERAAANLADDGDNYNDDYNNYHDWEARIGDGAYRQCRYNRL